MDIPTLIPTMASLWKNPRSRFWIACFTSSDGRQLKRSTGTADRRAALKIADDFEDSYRTVRTSRQVQKVMRDAHEALTGEKLEGTTVRQYADRWLQGKKGEGCSAGTMKFYSAATDKLTAYLKERADKPISRITKRDIEGIRDGLSGQLAPKTVAHYIKGLRMLFKSACADLGLPENPAQGVKLTVRRNPERKAFFTQEQLVKLLAQTEGEWRTLTLLGIYTGQRLGDLQNLKWADVDLEKRLFRIWNKKTSKAVTIPIAAPLFRHLDGMKKDQGFILPSLAPKKTNTLSGEFTDILFRCGLRIKTPFAGGPRSNTALSFHSLRHSAVSMLKTAGNALLTVQALIGHESAAMSEHYSHAGEDELRRAAESMPDFEAGL